MEELFKFFRKHRELITYLFVGGITSVIGMGGYWLLLFFGFSPVSANIFSWVAAVAFAYVANKKLVFQNQTKGLQQLLRQVTAFVSSRVFSLVVETVLIWAGTDLLQIDKYLIKIPVAVIVIILNYLTGKFVVFVKR